VRSGQREVCEIVVETRVPEERIDLVACSAVGRESGKDVVRICRLLEVRAMTNVTCCRRPGELIIRGTGMTVLAVERCVSPEQREPRELMPLDHVGDLPRLKRVTACAVCTELGFVDIDMTGRTELTGADKFELLMAADAACCLVLSIQREAGLCVVKRCIASHLPGICRVT
jgi:hypothetical protein